MSKAARLTVCDTNESAYHHWTKVNLRYGDTDRQGHINNAVFCTLYESGRVSFLFEGEGGIAGDKLSFVIVKLTLDFLEEMNFPGVAEVGSKILRVGTSSFTVGQAIFKDGLCCSTSESVIVMIDDSTKRSAPLTDAVRARLESVNRPG